MLTPCARALVFYCVILGLTVKSVCAEERLRDPTRPLFAVTGKVASKPKLRLQAIYDRNGNKTAVINGRSLKVGDSLGKAKVLEILSRSVSLEVEGRSEKLVLRPAIR